MSKIDMSGDLTNALIAQALNDHLGDCYAARKESNARMGRIEGILIAVAGFLIVQLAGTLLAIAVYVLTHPSALPR